MPENEIRRLQQELKEAHELIDAIRTGAIDALAVNGADGPQLYTLKSADHSYRLLVEKMNEGALMLNREGLILYANYSIAIFLKTSLKKLIGLSVFLLVDKEFQSDFMHLFEMSWKGHGKGEFMLKNEHSTWVPFYFSASIMDMENVQVLGVIITNLSAKNQIKYIRQKVAEQNALIEIKDKQLLKDKEIKLEAQRLAMVLEGLPQMAWTATPDGSINYYNQRWYNYTGFKTGDLSIKNLKLIVPEEMLKTGAAAWMESITHGKTYEREMLLKRVSDNTYRWHLIRARPIRNTEQKITLWVGTCTDIHDKKEALERLATATLQLKTYNEELEKKNEELIRTNNDLDSFLYLASHDLRAPISNIEGLLNAYFEENKIDNNDFPMVEMMFASVERFKRTILDLTEISKVNKELQHQLEEIRFDSLLEEIILDIKDLIQRKRAIITHNFAEPFMHFHSRNLRSILYNLISNAIKYSHPDRIPLINISSKKEGKFIVLTVCDNGLGLTPENQNKIFQMFQRIHTHEEGSGIGLYIIKRMIENVGGRIEVVSTKEEGSTFFVKLPVIMV